MPLTRFTAEQLTQLKAEFNQLETIEEKFTFWPTRLNLEFSETGYKFAQNLVQDFIINPKSKDEIEELNLLILEEARYIKTRMRFKVSRSVVFDFDSEKSELDKKLKGAINPLPILKREVDWLDEELRKHETVPVKDANYMKNEVYKWDELRRFWLFGYEEYYVRGKEPELRSYVYNSQPLLALMNGCAVAQFRAYIDKIEWEYSQKRATVAHEETSRKQQLLILYETGMLEKLSHLAVKDKNKLLAVLLNRSEANIRMDLNKIHKKGRTNSIRNEENLSFLFNLLQQTGFEVEAKEVKNELDKLR